MKIDMATLFSDHGLRVTQPRKAVFHTLESAIKPLSHREIATMTPTVDKASVYRIIEVFITLGIVVSIPHGWKQRYELASPFRPHHHHLLCIKCGAVEEIQSDKLEQIIHILADQQAFKIMGHTFEITGLCSMCQKDEEVRSI